MRMIKRDRELVLEDERKSSCSPGGVLERILDPKSWARWQPEILSAEGPPRLAPGDLVHGRANMLGFEVEGRSLATAVSDDAFEEDVVVGVRMRIRYRVSSDGGKTVVSHRLTADLPTGISGRALSFFLRRRLRRMQAEALDNLAAHCDPDPPD